MTMTVCETAILWQWRQVLCCIYKVHNRKQKIPLLCHTANTRIISRSAHSKFAICSDI